MSSPYTPEELGRRGQRPSVAMTRLRCRGLPAILALVLAAPASAIPRRVATILVRVDAQGRVIDRRAGSDRFSALRHEGWVKALRPPGVCIRTALEGSVPAWLDWGEHPTLGRALYPSAGLPVVWDARGLVRYMDYVRRHDGWGPVPVPTRVPEAARAWAVMAASTRGTRGTLGTAKGVR